VTCPLLPLLVVIVPRLPTPSRVLLLPPLPPLLSTGRAAISHDAIEIETENASEAETEATRRGLRAVVVAGPIDRMKGGMNLGDRPGTEAMIGIGEEEEVWITVRIPSRTCLAAL